MVNSCGMRIDLAVFDIDGTLSGPEGVFPSAVKALELVREKGVPVCIATGRTLPELPEDIKQAAGPRYLIGINGAMVEDLRTGRIITDRHLSRELSLRVLELVRRYKSGYCVYDSHRDLIDPESLANWDMWLENGSVSPWIPDEKVPSLEEYLRNSGGASKVCGAVLDREQFLKMREEAENMEGVTVTSSNGHEIEVLLAGTDKGAALLDLCEAEGIDPEHVFCLGDGENDAGMISAAGISVAMGNSDPLTLAAAKYRTSDCDRDGAYEAVLRFFS